MTNRECHRYQRKAPATFASVPPCTILCAVILPLVVSCPTPVKFSYHFKVLGWKSVKTLMRIN